MASGIYRGTLADASNRAHWSEPFSLVDDETGDAVVLAENDEVEVWVTAASTTDTPLLHGSIGTGHVVISETGDGTWTFPPAEMAVLSEGTYRVFVRATVGGVVYQLGAVDLPVIEGGPA